MFMKKISMFSIVLCFVLLVSALPCQALGLVKDPQGVVRPMFTYIDWFTANLDITGTGRADIDVSICASGSERTGVRADLQKFIQGSWTTIKTWSVTNNSGICTMSNSWYVDTGYAYRVVAYGYVYRNGNVVESTSITTPSQSY